MDSESIKINSTDSITLSADTIINSATWTTVTGTATPYTISATPGYTVSTSTATVPIEDIETLKNDLKRAPLTMFTETIKPKKEKLDPRLVKINKEIEEIRKKTHFYHIKEYVPEKVYGFIFKNKKDREYKTICSDEDSFDLTFAFALAYAKQDAGDILTINGIIQRAHDYFDFKSYTKEFKNGIKLFHKLQEKEALEEQIRFEKKHRHDKLVQKKIAKKERKKYEQYDIIKAAIKDSKF